jgi:predicted nucleotidyltransferase
MDWIATNEWKTRHHVLRHVSTIGQAGLPAGEAAFRSGHARLDRRGRAAHRSGGDPDQIILFGSAARGETHEDSDLDLLVVKSGVPNHRRMQGQIDSLFWDKAVALDVLVRSPEAIQRALAQGNSFLRDQVLEKGHVLYEKPSSAQ